MTTELEARLDTLEVRVHELEAELAELRALAVNGHVPAFEHGLPWWALDSLERDDYRSLFKEVERARSRAVSEHDLDGLIVLNDVILAARERSPVGVDVRAAELGQAVRQNIRYVARTLGVEVDESALRGGEPPVEEAAPVRAETIEARPEPAPAPVIAPRPPVPPRPPRISLPELSSADLFGAKALAIAGGIVTLLGIVFIFVLAVNRGWIGPDARIALGGLAAAVLYTGGLVLRRRYGETDASLAAVAAGIAGAYMVLLAAAQLYHLVGDVGALLVAVGIAAVGLWTALRWRSEILAGIGLLGAMLAPAAVALPDGISATVIAFTAFMAIATAVVAVRERWNVLLVAGAAVSLPQALALALQGEYRGQAPADVVALSAVFAAITVGSGVAKQLRDRSRELRPLATSFLFAGTSFAVACALRLYWSPESRGFALLAVAAALLVVAGAFLRRPHDRDLSALLGALGLVVGGIAFGELMSGSPLAFAWAGEAAVLAWLAVRVRDVRYQLWALVYFGAALVHVLAIDVPPSHLFEPLETSAGGALAVVALGAAAAVIAFQTSARAIPFAPRRGVFAPLTPILRGLGECQFELRVVSWSVSGLAGVYALSLGILAACSSFDWGHVAMYSVWSAIGLGLYVFGLRRGQTAFRVAGLVALTLTGVAAVANGQAELGASARAVACLVAGITLLAAVLVELFAVLGPRLGALRDDERARWLVFAWGAGATSVAVLSVGVVAAIPSYDWGRVSMFALWSALGLGVLHAALRRGLAEIGRGGAAALVVTVAVSFPVGYRYLESTPRGVAFVVVGIAVLAAALALQLVPRVERLTQVAFGFVLASVGLGLAAVVELFDGSAGSLDERGLAILVLAGLYAALAAAVRAQPGQRDFSTLLSATALVLGYGASERLLPETFHVLALSLAAVGLAWLARRAREPRFLVASAAALLVGASTVVFSAAPPNHLFVPHAHPGSGALGALLVALAAAVVGRLAGGETELRRRFALVCCWGAGILTIYGLSIFILALFQAAFGGSVDTNFHRGHTAVSAFWGLIGLALLYVGLTRYRALRVAGFVMFAVSLLKIFIFDLPSLSSITRALSFLAVGAVLLLGGFFYQRLATSQPAQPKRTKRPVERPEGLGRADMWIGLLAAATLVIWFGTGAVPLGLS